MLPLEVSAVSSSIESDLVVDDDELGILRTSGSVVVPLADDAFSTSMSSLEEVLQQRRCVMG